MGVGCRFVIFFFGLRERRRVSGFDLVCVSCLEFSFRSFFSFSGEYSSALLVGDIV